MLHPYFENIQSIYSLSTIATQDVGRVPSTPCTLYIVMCDRDPVVYTFLQNLFILFTRITSVGLVVRHIEINVCRCVFDEIKNYSFYMKILTLLCSEAIRSVLFLCVLSGFRLLTLLAQSRSGSLVSYKINFRIHLSYFIIMKYLIKNIVFRFFLFKIHI